MQNSDFDAPYPLAEYRAKMIARNRLCKLADLCEKQNLDLMLARSDEKRAWGLAMDGRSLKHFILDDQLRPASEQEAIKSVPNPILVCDFR